MKISAQSDRKRAKYGTLKLPVAGERFGCGWKGLVNFYHTSPLKQKLIFKILVYFDFEVRFDFVTLQLKHFWDIEWIFIGHIS